MDQVKEYPMTYPHKRTTDEGNTELDCQLCGEKMGFVMPDDWYEYGNEKCAEMYSPEWPEDSKSVICHAQCGIELGLDIA